MCYTGGPYCARESKVLMETARQAYKQDPSEKNAREVFKTTVAYQGTGEGQKELDEKIKWAPSDMAAEQYADRKAFARETRKKAVKKAKVRQLAKKYDNNRYAEHMETMAKTYGATISEGPYGNSDSDRSKTAEFPYRDGVVRVTFQDRAMRRNSDGSPDWSEPYALAEGYYIKKEENGVEAQKPVNFNDATLKQMKDKKYLDNQIDSCTNCKRQVSYNELKPTYGASRVCSNCYSEAMDRGDRTYAAPSRRGR